MPRVHFELVLVRSGSVRTDFRQIRRKPERQY
jgi:hypothetical protein